MIIMIIIMIVVGRAQEEELGGEDDILQEGLPQERQVRLPVGALLVVRGPCHVMLCYDTLVYNMYIL